MVSDFYLYDSRVSHKVVDLRVDAASMNCVYLEHHLGALYLERSADIQRYTRIFERLVDSALAPDESLQPMTTLAREL